MVPGSSDRCARRIQLNVFFFFRVRMQFQHKSVCVCVCTLMTVISSRRACTYDVEFAECKLRSLLIHNDRCTEPRLRMRHRTHRSSTAAMRSVCCRQWCPRGGWRMRRVRERMRLCDYRCPCVCMCWCGAVRVCVSGHTHSSNRPKSPVGAQW